MNKRTALDELNRMLDERGIPWEEGEGGLTVCDLDDLEWWIGNAMPQNDLTHTKVCAHVCYPTPEEAIELMVGRGTCRCTTPDDAWCFSCSACGKSFPRNELNIAHNHGEINYCPNCGRRVVGE